MKTAVSIPVILFASFLGLAPTNSFSIEPCDLESTGTRQEIINAKKCLINWLTGARGHLENSVATREQQLADVREWIDEWGRCNALTIEYEAGKDKFTRQNALECWHFYKAREENLMRLIKRINQGKNITKEFEQIIRQVEAKYSNLLSKERAKYGDN